MAATVVFYAQFVASKAGKNSLTPTVDVERITRADGTRSALVTGGSATAVGRRGLYYYLLANADLLTYDYLATFITADTSVDQQEIPALWVEWSIPHTSELANLDAAISTRLASAGYTAPPTANQVRDAILSDGQRFAGANIDAAISTRLGAANAANTILSALAADFDNIPGSVAALLGLLVGIDQRTSGPAAVTVSNPVAQNGDVLTIQGDGYKAIRGRALQWNVHSAGLDLTGATVTAVIEGETSLACAVQNPAADTKTIVCEPNAEQTATISAGRHKYSLAARWPDDPDPATLVAGWWTSDERPSVP